MSDNLSIGALLVCIPIIVIAPLIGLMVVILPTLCLLYKGYLKMIYRYGYVCYEEKGLKRDTGSEPVNEAVYDSICEMCMKNGFKVLVSFSDRDPNRVQTVISDTRTIYKNNGTPIDNLKKTV